MVRIGALSSLRRYPIKSMAGEDLAEARVALAQEADGIAAKRQRVPENRHAAREPRRPAIDGRAHRRASSPRRTKSS